MKKVILATLLTIGAVVFSTTSVSANDVGGTQQQNQKVITKNEEKCETTSGQYGTRTCTNSTETTTEQSQNQKILASQVIYRNGRYIKIHAPADTALDTTTVSIILAAAVLGLGASVALTKIE